MRAHSPYFQYTVVALGIHGLPNAEQVFAHMGGVWAERTCTVIASGGRNSAGYMVAVPDPFRFVEAMRSLNVVVDEPRVMYHGTLGDYFTNPRTEQDGQRRAATAERRCAEWRTKHDDFQTEED